MNHAISALFQLAKHYAKAMRDYQPSCFCHPLGYYWQCAIISLPIFVILLDIILLAVAQRSFDGPCSCSNICYKRRTTLVSVGWHPSIKEFALKRDPLFKSWWHISIILFLVELSFLQPESRRSFLRLIKHKLSFLPSFFSFKACILLPLGRDAIWAW